MSQKTGRVRRKLPASQKYLKIRGWLVLPTKLFCGTATTDQKCEEEKREPSSIDQVKMGPKLTPQQRKQLRRLLEEFVDLFHQDPSIDTAFKNSELRIPLKPGAAPVAQAPYPYSNRVNEEMKKTIDKLLKAGVIRPSNSPWAAPVVMVRRPGSDKFRMCVDYRKLNELTKTELFPLPRIKDLHHQLRGAKWLSTMDCLCGFWQVIVAEEDRAKTAFISKWGHFEFTRAPFGLKNMPSVFSRIMDRALVGLNHVFCLVYIDDICCKSETFEDHLQHLEKIFERLREHHISLKGSKCFLGFQELKFLGYIASGEGIRPCPDKVKSIVEFGTPRNIKELQSFLGAANWFRDTVENFAGISAPLTLLLKKRHGPNDMCDGKTKSMKGGPPKRRWFVWEEAQEQAFQAVKDAMAKQTMLHHVEPGRMIHIDADASDVAIGAVLYQIDDDGNRRPILFTSRALSDAEKKWPLAEREALAIVDGLKGSFRPHVMGTKFIVHTDHANLRALTRMKTGKGARWGLILSEFAGDMQLQFKAGKVNTMADALSRDPRFDPHEESGREEKLSLADALAMSGATNKPAAPPATVQRLQREDPTWSALIHHLETGELPENNKEADRIRRLAPHHVLDHQGVLRCTSAPAFRHCMVMQPPVCLPEALRERVMREIHSRTHNGVSRTYRSLAERFHWPGMRKDVARFVANCEICAKAKAVRRKREHIVRTKKPARAAHETVFIDLWGRLPTSPAGHRYVLVVICALTRFVHLIPLTTATGNEVMQALKRIFCMFGFPKRIHSDRGSEFKNEVIDRFCERFNVRHTFSPAWHPESNGGAEVFMRFLKSRMQIFIKELRADWDEHLPAIQLAHNAGVLTHSTFSPFQLMFGRQLLHTPTDLSNSVEERTQDLAVMGEEMVSMMKECWKRAAEDHQAAKIQQEKWANAPKQARQECKLCVGDWVLMHAPRRSDAKKGLASKLVPAWRGPYEIVRKVRDAVFILRDPATEKETDPVHADRLTRFRGDPPTARSDAPRATRDRKDAEPFTQDEVVLVLTKLGPFLAKVWVEAEADKETIEVHWLNSRSRASMPMHRKRFKESHFDPKDGKAVFTNKPPAGFEPELGLIQNRDILARDLRLHNNGTLTQASARVLQQALRDNHLMGEDDG